MPPLSGPGGRARKGADRPRKSLRLHVKDPAATIAVELEHQERRCAAEKAGFLLQSQPRRVKQRRKVLKETECVGQEELAAASALLSLSKLIDWKAPPPFERARIPLDCPCGKPRIARIRRSPLPWERRSLRSIPPMDRFAVANIPDAP